MDLRQQHERDIGRIQDALIGDGNGENVAFTRPGNYSNTVRSRGYGGRPLPLEGMNKVVEVDQQKRIAYVEPRVTMEQLVDATLPFGLVPAVVPEFKTITVGGAINGAALESSSHRHGQFNDCCLAYELLLADGARLRATPAINSDLFYGIAGSYGSLALIVGVEIALVPAKPWVILNYSQYDSIQEAVASMAVEPRPEFLEAIVYSAKKTVVIAGRPADKPEGPLISMNHWWSQWFYQHVNQTKNALESMSLKDYLFRSDRAAFWMGGYALHTPLLLRYICEYIGWCPSWVDRLLTPAGSSRYCKMKPASFLFRFLWGWLLPSGRLYSLLHRGTERWFADRFVIQDYYIPQKESAFFCHDLLARYGIAPLWLCPIKATRTPQLFSPHLSEAELLFDVGVYGMAEKSLPGHAVTMEIDSMAAAIGGKKMLYSQSYYTKEEFWSLYDEEAYLKLRERYFAGKRFLPITTKVLSSPKSS